MYYYSCYHACRVAILARAPPEFEPSANKPTLLQYTGGLVVPAVFVLTRSIFENFPHFVHDGDLDGVSVRPIRLPSGCYL